MPPANRKALVLVVSSALLLTACTDPAAVSEGSSSSSSSTTTTSTSGPSTADSTGGPGVPCPIVPHTDPALAQVLMPNFGASSPFDSRVGTLCPNTSHYFALDNPCAAYLALDLRGNPTAIDNNTEDFDLYLTKHYDPMQPGGSYVVHESNGSASVTIGSQPALPFEGKPVAECLRSGGPWWARSGVAPRSWARSTIVDRETSGRAGWRSGASAGWIARRSRGSMV